MVDELARARDLELINLFLPARNQIRTGRARPAAAFSHAPPVPSTVVPKSAAFSVFKREHMAEAGRIIKEMMSAPNVDCFFGLCDEFRDVLNDDLYFYCTSVAASHRKDIRSSKMPPIFQTRVRLFIRKRQLQDAHRAAVMGVPAPRAVTPTDLVGERAMDYWREDVMVNSHHWHWHVVYPGTGVDGIMMDRRGELFYYMHKQMIARYNAERLSNGLGPVLPFDEWDKPIKEEYDPDLTGGKGTYAVRNPYMTLAKADSDRLTELQGEIDYDGIGTDIDVLGTAVETGVHNNGHNFISKLRDESSDENPGGVMGYVETAVRDVVFFRWHKCVDDMFDPYKAKLTAYPNSELVWSGIKVTNVEILDEGLRTTPTLRTFMRTQEFDMTLALDFGDLPPGSDPVTVSLTHIDHNKFSYRITVENTTGSDQKATVRLFLIPTNDENGVENVMNNYNNRCIEMDRFYEDIPTAGAAILRASSDSSVVIPWGQSVKALQKEAGHEPGQTEEDFCGCGWPEHMQIPRGKSGGMDFKVIAMLSNYEDDKVANPSTATCKKNAASYCGLRDQKYPDKRNMGYPFDKPFASPVDQQTISQFVNGKDNFNYTDICIVDTRQNVVSA